MLNRYLGFHIRSIKDLIRQINVPMEICSLAAPGRVGDGGQQEFKLGLLFLRSILLPAVRLRVSRTRGHLRRAVKPFLPNHQNPMLPALEPKARCSQIPHAKP